MTRLLLHTDAPDEPRAIIEAAHPDIEITMCTSYAALAEAVRTNRPEIVYTSRFAPARFPREALIGVDGVRWISNAGSGCNHLIPWDPEVQTVTNSAGVAAEGMAQYALATMLHFAMDITGLQRDQRARVWRTREVRPLAGATLLLVGVGKTGQEAARLGKAMGLRIEGVRRSGAPVAQLDAVHRPDGLADAMARADYILVCLPLTAESRGMIGRAALDRVKPGAVLVDLSRGGIVDHAALIAALDDGRLSGAALDVFPDEPLPPEDPIWAREDVLVSPHCSGVYPGWEARSAEMFTRNLTRWCAGKPLKNIVDPHTGY